MAETINPSTRIAPRFNAWYEIAGAGVAVIEASWVVLLFQSLSEGTGGTPLLPAYALFALSFYLAYQLFRFLQASHVVQNAARGLLLALYLLLAWAGVRILLPGEAAGNFDALSTSLKGLGEVTRLIPAHFWLWAALLWLYFRGMGAARQGVGSSAVQRHFKLGVFMFLLYSLVAFAAERDLPGLGIFAVFLFATLLSMSAAKVSLLGRLRGGRRSPFNRSWFGSMVAAVVGTVGAGFSLAMLATGRFLLFYRQLLNAVLLTVITLTLSPFIFVLGLFSTTTLNPAEAPPPTPALPPWEQDPGFSIDLSGAGSEQVDILPPDLRVYYYWGMTALAVLLLLSLFWGVRVVRRRRGRVEITEYVYQRGDLLSRFRKELEKRGRELRASLFGGNALKRGQQILAAARIRRVYAELIRLAESFGAPREPAQTPLEFSAALQERMPSVRGDLDGITGAYLKIRYGELPERVDEVRTVEAAWSRVQAVGAGLVERYRIRQEVEAKERRRQARLQG